MSNKTDLRTNDTKERIIKEAQRLYHVGGYKNMALEKIAETLNITRPALYHHFPRGKEELFLEMMGVINDDMLKGWQTAIASGQDTRSRLKNMMLFFLNRPSIDARRMLIEEYKDFSEGTRLALWRFFETMRQSIIGVLREGIEKGELRPLNLDLACFSFLNICEMSEGMCEMKNHVSAEMRERFPLQLKEEELIDQLLDMWLQGTARHSNHEV